MMKKILQIRNLLILMAAVTLMAAGCNNPVTTSSPQSPPINTQSDVPITYPGEDGKDALTLLKVKNKVETKTFSGVGEFVDSINGIKPDDQHFWGFYVNGASSNVGAGQYISKSTDTLEWKLDQINSSQQ